MPRREVEAQLRPRRKVEDEAQPSISRRLLATAATQLVRRGRADVETVSGTKVLAMPDWAARKWIPLRSVAAVLQVDEDFLETTLVEEPDGEHGPRLYFKKGFVHARWE